MWDVGGQATKLWKHYFDKIDAIIFVVDAAQVNRDPEGRYIQKSKFELHKLSKDPALQKVPILVMVNKIDLLDELPNDGNQEESDCKFLQDRIELKRKEIQDVVVKALDLASLHGSTFGEEGAERPKEQYLDVPGEPF